MPFDNDTAWKLSLTLSQLRKNLLSNFYPRTLLLLEMAFPILIEEYLEAPCQPGIKGEDDNFSAYVENTLRKKVPQAKYERVKDVYTLEKAKLEFLNSEQRNSLQIYLRDLHFQDKVSELMNRPNEWLFAQSISVSQEIAIIQSKWNWSLTEDFKIAGKEKVGKKFSQNFSDAPREFLYFLQVFGKLEITEVAFAEITLLLWEQFKTPKTIRAAIDDIAGMLQRMPAANWQAWLVPELNHKKIQTPADLLKELDWLMLKYLKPLLYRHVLVFNH
jgi:hypothetical protein